MAAAASSGEKLQNCSNEKNGSKKSPNNNFERKENCKDLLKVCPERGLDKYLLEKNKQINAQRKTYKPSACPVLQQVKDFLPIMKQAQEELSLEDHGTIEDVEDGEPCINMDLQLVELDDTSSDSYSSDENIDTNVGEINENNLMLKKTDKIKKPLIEDIT
ncbi:uncharacterized protein LOC114521919 [Dendronephthya gigantea]|uniref:uncharacterized protein LOC114521919 n=1 Tax=Dendronephthya gigantea TaxID=151771 RepID=UPI001068F2D2|nr:uncharacterized protein LOC114521919 [Dendronephthya gigantea]